MKKLIIFLVLIVFLISGCETKIVKYADCELVSRVIDGDTFELQSGLKVRLIGIDTPEKGDFYYGEAKSALSRIIMGKCVVLTKDKTDLDIYNRLLRYAYVEGVFVNEYMVEQGYAESYRYEPDIKFMDVFDSAQERAKSAKLGIWISLIVTCADLGCAADDEYAGSIKSDLYHACNSSVAKIINRENLICFKSREHAEELGYTAGKSAE